MEKEQIEARTEKIRAQREELRKKLLRLENEKRRLERKADTRRKILAGSALLNQYEKSDEKMKDYFEKLLKSNLKPKDFEFLFPEKSKPENVA